MLGHLWPALKDELLFGHWVLSDSFWHHGLPHTRLPCPSPSPWVCSGSCPLSQWCHPIISSSVAHFSSPKSFLASGSFPMSWPKYWSFSFSINPSNEYSGLVSSRIYWLESPCSPRDSQESSTPQFKSIYSLAHSLLYGPTLTSVHDYWKNRCFDYTDLCQKGNVFAF